VKHDHKKAQSQRKESIFQLNIRSGEEDWMLRMVGNCVGREKQQGIRPLSGLVGAR
jgi:hypothetical protein